jgi:tetratricopeptide (TPR) repeat protein
MERLVEPFMRAMDDLTPYYQARMKQLSLQQRKIIELLCDRRGAITVKEIAQRCFITHQTTSSQLKLLREMRYVKATTIGRESFYELNEPLMRISLEVKKHRGEPLRLFVEFLRCWYTKPELEDLLKLIPTEAKTEAQYIKLALDLSQQASEDPKVASCRHDLKRYKEDGKFEKALKVLDELIALEGATYNNLVERGNILTDLEKHEDALKEFNKALDLDKDQAFAWLGSGYNYMNLSQYDEGIRAYDKVIDIGLDIPSVWWLRGRCLQELGHHEQAVQSFKKVTEQDPTYKDGWVSLGESLYELNKYLESYDAFSKVAQLDINDKRAQYYQIRSLFMAGHFQQAISLCEEYNSFLSETTVFIGLKATILTDLDRDVEALACWQEVINKGDRSTYIRLGKVGSLIALQHWDEAQIVLDEAFNISHDEKPPQPVGAGQILEKLFNTKQDVKFWQKGITLLVTSYASHNVLSALAAGLVRNINRILPPTVSDAIAELWRDQWKTAAGNYPEMAMALRLLDTVIMYRLKKDGRILMELPIEERKFIEEIIEKMENNSGDSEERGKKG